MSEPLKPETVPIEGEAPRPVDTPVDLSDPAHVKARNNRLRREAVLRDNTLKMIMTHKNGREFIYWLLQICGVNAPTFATNALIMAHTAGEQNVGRQILAQITTRDTIDLYVQMLKEGAGYEG